MTGSDLTPSAEEVEAVPPENSSGRSSCGSSFVAMVQTRDLRDGDNRPELVSLDRAAFRGIVPPENSTVRWSCGSPLVTMVQTSDLRDGDNPPERLLPHTISQLRGAGESIGEQGGLLVPAAPGPRSPSSALWVPGKMGDSNSVL